MKTPVVLTAYNRPHYLEVILDSISGQCWDERYTALLTSQDFEEDVELV